MLEEITSPFHNGHPWFKLLSKNHYDELWLPDIFPSELQREFQFIRTPPNMDDPSIH